LPEDDDTFPQEDVEMICGTMLEEDLDPFGRNLGERSLPGFEV